MRENAWLSTNVSLGMLETASSPQPSPPEEAEEERGKTSQTGSDK